MPPFRIGMGDPVCPPGLHAAPIRPLHDQQPVHLFHGERIRGRKERREPPETAVLLPEPRNHGGIRRVQPAHLGDERVPGMGGSVGEAPQLARGGQRIRLHPPFRHLQRAGRELGLHRRRLRVLAGDGPALPGRDGQVSRPEREGGHRRSGRRHRLPESGFAL